MVAVFFDEVPFVDDDDHALFLLFDVAGDVQILRREALGGVDHEQDDVGALDRAHRAEHAELLDPVLDPALAANSGGVDQRSAARPAQTSWVSRLSRVVPGTSLTIDRSCPIKALSNRLLPTFGRPTIAILGPSVSGSSSNSRQRFDDAVEQIAGAGAVIGRDGDRIAEAELVKLERVVAALDIVGFVGDEDRRFVGAAKNIGDFMVAGGDARFGVDHQDDDVSFVDRGLRLLAGVARDLGRAWRGAISCSSCKTGRCRRS